MSAPCHRMWEQLLLHCPFSSWLLGTWLSWSVKNGDKDFVAIVPMRNLEPDPSTALLMIIDGLVQSRRFPRKMHDSNFNVRFFAHVSAEAVLDMIVLLKFLFRSTGVQVLVGNTTIIFGRAACLISTTSFNYWLRFWHQTIDVFGQFATQPIYICWRSTSNNSALKKHRVIEDCCQLETFGIFQLLLGPVLQVG